MPLIETDLLYSFLNANDINHKFANNIILRVHNSELEVKFSSVSLIELQLIYKSKNIEYEFELDLVELQRIKNIEWALLDTISSLTAIHLRKKYNLSFFDSLHVGIAINLDKQIISQDKEYDKIMGLKRIPLKTFH
ncbi:MAG: PIN domain-containing protein [Candidatus Lokiarchaeota archaeon]|nr:PIN domain-containing protein [Candidatus Lokiarchaeota archaeon]